MNILVCNDDGIKSEGIIKLSEKLSETDKVMVVAPEKNMSACSHSLSIGKPIRLSEEKDFKNKNLKAYSISGTPADCVKIAHHVLCDFKANICVSGINKGHNLGSDTMYSGTLSVAIEAAYFGCISFAFSSFSYDNSDFDGFAVLAKKIIDFLLPYSVKGDVWNINFPIGKAKDVKGFKLTPLGIHKYMDYYEKTSDDEYVLKGYPLFDENDKNDCDIFWVNSGYVSITPVLFNRTDYIKVDRLRAECERLS